MEGRGRPEDGLSERTEDRTQSRKLLPSALARVHEAASRDKKTRFTALLHHVNVEALERAFGRLKRGAAAGVDGETVATYEQGLSEKLQDLCDRVHRGRYRPEPVRRVYIPKPDGGQRPLGIPALEDKIVQGAVAEVLSAIYEVDFVGFSYGFRPGRSPHQALRALHTALMTQYVNWVLDADIRRFFDSVNHEWLLRMLAHRVADPRILGLIRGWLRGRRARWERVVRNRRRYAARCGHQSAARQRLPALRARPVGPSMEEAARARTGRHRALCRRFRDGLPVRGGRAEDDGRPSGAPRHVWLDAPRRQDAPHRIRAALDPNDVKRAATGGRRRLPSSASRITARGAETAASS